MNLDLEVAVLNIWQTHRSIQNHAVTSGAWRIYTTILWGRCGQSAQLWALLLVSAPLIYSVGTSSDKCGIYPLDLENDQRALRSGGPGPREQGGAGTKGRTLGRPNVACDWDCYRYRHPDLALFDDKTAAAHYIESGAAEGRLCTCEFSEAANGQVNAKYEYMLQSSAFQVTLLSAGL